jgi:hypothetical protein
VDLRTNTRPGSLSSSAGGRRRGLNDVTMKPYERAGLVDATDIPLAGKDSVVRPVLSIPEPRPGKAHFIACQFRHPGQARASLRQKTFRWHRFKRGVPDTCGLVI